MKVAVTATERESTSPVDPRFGRARYFIVVDPGTGETTAHDNVQNLNAAQGAGIQAAETVVRLGVHAVVTGHVGPKAYRALTAAGIPVYLSGETTVGEAARRCAAGELERIDAADMEGHWV